MAEPQKFCVVEDIFFITGRGLVIVPGQWQAGALKPGDWLEIRSAAGQNHLTQLSAIEMVRFRPGVEPVVDSAHLFPFLVKRLGYGEVNRGDEVWSVSNPPPPETSSTVSRQSHKPWWRRLFLGRR